WMKYWLMVVSSAVSTRLSSSMICGSPFMAEARVFGSWPDCALGAGLGASAICGFAQPLEGGLAAAAVGAGPTGRRQLLGRVGAGRNGGGDGAFVDAATNADDHCLGSKGI